MCFNLRFYEKKKIDIKVESTIVEETSRVSVSITKSKEQ